EGTAVRLSACLSWELEDRAAGTELFKKAAMIDRRAGRVNEEFHTLTTWREFNGYSQWDDLLADELSAEIHGHISAEHVQQIKEEAAHIGRSVGHGLFPAEETKRIHELARKNGRFPVLWEQAVWAMCNVID